MISLFNARDKINFPFYNSIDWAFIVIETDPC